ncbi:hypothetical protein EMGBS3_08730, partial [Anaerolineaceae bacterium]
MTNLVVETMLDGEQSVSDSTLGWLPARKQRPRPKETQGTAEPTLE